MAMDDGSALDSTLWTEVGDSLLAEAIHAGQSELVWIRVPD